MSSHKMGAILRSWLPLAVAITLLAGILYGALQQALRQSANDPQIQMAEDAAAALAAGQAPPAAPAVEISSSLAPYLIVFDGQGRPLAGSARLHGKLPTVPLGALEAARRSGQNRVTWQPEPGVRSATVIVPFGGPQLGYVLAGRSLHEVEQRANSLLLLITLGGLVTLGATLFVTIIVNVV